MYHLEPNDFLHIAIVHLQLGMSQLYSPNTTYYFIQLFVQTPPIILKCTPYYSAAMPSLDDGLCTVTLLVNFSTYKESLLYVIDNLDRRLHIIYTPCSMNYIRCRWSYAFLREYFLLQLQ